MIEPATPALICESWSDHAWSAPRFVEHGRHLTMGAYQKFLVRCERCGHETTLTEWLTLSGTLAPGGIE
jgi:hypothetical protein